jgi:hypothetical protein
MSNRFIYVVDAHFIDKIKNKNKKILDPSACGFTWLKIMIPIKNSINNNDFFL